MIAMILLAGLFALPFALWAKSFLLERSARARLLDAVRRKDEAEVQRIFAQRPFQDLSESAYRQSRDLANSLGAHQMASAIETAHFVGQADASPSIERSDSNPFPRRFARRLQMQILIHLTPLICAMVGAFYLAQKEAEYQGAAIYFGFAALMYLFFAYDNGFDFFTVYHASGHMIERRTWLPKLSRRFDLSDARYFHYFRGMYSASIGIEDSQRNAIGSFPIFAYDFGALELWATQNLEELYSHESAPKGATSKGAPAFKREKTAKTARRKPRNGAGRLKRLLSFVAWVALVLWLFDAKEIVQDISIRLNDHKTTVSAIVKSSGRYFVEVQYEWNGQTYHQELSTQFKFERPRVGDARSLLLDPRDPTNVTPDPVLGGWLSWVFNIICGLMMISMAIPLFFIKGFD